MLIEQLTEIMDERNNKLALFQEAMELIQKVRASTGEDRVHYLKLYQDKHNEWLSVKSEATQQFLQKD